MASGGEGRCRDAVMQRYKEQVQGRRTSSLSLKRSMRQPRVVWKANITQEDALGFCLDCHEDETMEGVQVAIIDNPGNDVVVHTMNPCSYDGFIFSAFEIDGAVTDLVVDVERHRAVYSPKSGGATFEVMKHCQNSSDGRAVCMMCVALNGYHNEESTYTWRRNVSNCWILLHDEIHPIIYTTLEGKYTCQVQVSGQETVGAFEVQNTAQGALLARVYEKEDSTYHFSDQNTIETMAEDTSSVVTPKEAEKNTMDDVSLHAEVFGSHFKSDDFEDPNNVRLIEVIGRGTYGVVHKGVWRGSIVAVKQIMTLSSGATSGTNDDRLIKEIEAFQVIQHPNILCLLGTIRDKSSVMIIMNYVEGLDLQSMIFDERNKRLLLSTKIWISIQVPQALMFLHTARPSMVHLDVKPANILVQKRDKHVFLADFGLSRVISSSHVLGTKTIQSGTPGFQAPEQLRAELIDVGADDHVYAFGALLIELFSEKPIWEGLTRGVRHFLRKRTRFLNLLI